MSPLETEAAATIEAVLAAWDDRLNDALSGEADAVRRAESAELGCEIAYKREPTQAEGDAHADGAKECFVSMGGWTGRRCRVCDRWVWGGPTACLACVADEKHDDLLEQHDSRGHHIAALEGQLDTKTKTSAAWEGLYNERNRLWREEADRVGAVKLLLEKNGCDCDCDHDAESHDSDCDRCLACRISWAIET